MSIVSSYISARAPFFRINAQAVSIMDSIFAIAIGLGVRVVIDLVGHQDNKLTGTLVGLWEGVVMQHFLKKMPKSCDPYVAYGVRLWVDFLFTESLSRLVLTLVWTGMGIILADIAPAIWVDVGLRRLWRRFRRDLYIITQSVPTIPWFARPRTVRFSPSRTASVVSSALPSVVTNTNTAQVPTRPATAASVLRKRSVPGAFPGDFSETETELESVLGLRSPRSESSTSPGTAHHRFSSLPRRRATVETESEVSYDLDEGNISSSDSSYTRTPLLNEADMPIIEDEEDVDTEKEVVRDKRKQKEEETTPKQNPMVLPPTPSDSAFAVHQPNEPQEVQPPVAEVPNIPDDEDWENISRREALHTPPPTAAKDTPPTPPAKDVQFTARPSSPRPPQVALSSTSNNQEQLVETGSTPLATQNPFDGLFSSNNTPLPQQPEVDPSAATTSFALPAPAPAPATTQSGDAMEYSFLGRPPSYSQLQPDLDNFLNTQVLSQTGATGNNAAGELMGTTETPANGDAGGEPGNAEGSGTVAETGIMGAIQQPSGEQMPVTEEEPSASTQGPSAPAQKSPAPAEASVSQQTSKQPEPAPIAAAEAQVGDESVPVDDEPIPEKSSDRLARALALRKQATDMNKGVAELKRQLKAARDDDEVTLSSQKQSLVDASMKEIDKLNAKADRWYTAVRNGEGTEPSDALDLSDVVGDDVVAMVEDALTQLVLKNQPTLRVQTALSKNGRKAQKNTLTALLDGLKIKNQVNPLKGREIVITLPTTSIPTDS